MVNPLVLLEMAAFWPLAIGLFALIFRKQTVSLGLRIAGKPLTDKSRAAWEHVVLFGALFLIDLGVGAFVWSFLPSVRIPTVIVVIAIAIPLSVLSAGNVLAARSGRR